MILSSQPKPSHTGSQSENLSNEGATYRFVGQNVDPQGGKPGPSDWCFGPAEPVTTRTNKTKVTRKQFFILSSSYLNFDFW
jgi:hypothetical protein